MSDLEILSLEILKTQSPLVKCVHLSSAPLTPPLAVASGTGSNIFCLGAGTVWFY